MAGVNAEWNDIVRDLDRVEQVTIEQASKRFLLRPQGPRLRRRGVQSGRCGVAAVGPADPDRHAAARCITSLTAPPPRTLAAWCHVVLNFLDSRFISYSS